ncbi:atypical kinase COQ8B, mitochondrial-like isoform X1 [Daphnia carinata]|uniref:atypical kinase COQ8B, mitochondrial-like isoform X1 n=1 Tax=Daphnia carinata TaxID=120202 RepID=UPI0025799531|nr:atypical kinase COQ8B, mitochondrial-like isoform X1 [Daphnia carinata]
MAKLLGTDFFVILRGLNAVSRAAANVTEAELREAWTSSSSSRPQLQNLFVKNCKPEDIANNVKDAAGRSFAVIEGLKQFTSVAARKLMKTNYNVSHPSKTAPEDAKKFSDPFPNQEVHEPPVCVNETNNGSSDTLPQPTNFDVSPLAKPGNLLRNQKIPEGSKESCASFSTSSAFKSPVMFQKSDVKSHSKSHVEKKSGNTGEPGKPNVPIPPVAKKNRVPKLSETSREVPVPSSRIGRLASYGSLAAGLGIGALAEVTRRTLGMNKTQAIENNVTAVLDSNPFLTDANAERIVNTLCKVRGAALKLGQMLSMQDDSLINPQLQKIFERVRQSADFMPVRQMEGVLVNELGPDWRNKLKDFQEKPFAAASIGQVHLATLLDGRQVAMKIQYPGVAKGIESDINNLVAVMNMWNIIPKGMYMEEFIKVAKVELAWEVDYLREAECARKFAELIKDMPYYKIPAIIDELSTKQVITSEYVEGISMEECMKLDQDTRNDVAEKMLFLCLLEVFQFRFMQTDPNWANFMYDPLTRKIILIDFGASREYSKEFVDKYIKIIEGAAKGDRQQILEYSKTLGFLTGYESKIMKDAHVEAVLVLGEAFRHDEPFDFGTQDTSRRVHKLIPVMLSHRLCAPPQETYSLHRKMSGAFLLCAKLGAKINCKAFFDAVIEKYHAQPK